MVNEPLKHKKSNVELYLPFTSVEHIEKTSRNTDTAMILVSMLRSLCPAVEVSSFISRLVCTTCRVGLFFYNWTLGGCSAFPREQSMRILWRSISNLLKCLHFSSLQKPTSPGFWCFTLLLFFFSLHLILSMWVNRENSCSELGCQMKSYFEEKLV